MKRVERLQINELSKYVFGTASRWQKRIKHPLLVPVMSGDSNKIKYWTPSYRTEELVINQMIEAAKEKK